MAHRDNGAPGQWRTGGAPALALEMALAPALEMETVKTTTELTNATKQVNANANEYVTK